jgi:hypothetical protein
MSRNKRRKNYDVIVTQFADFLKTGGGAMMTRGIQRGFNLQFALARVGNRRGKSSPVPCVGHFDLCHILKVSRGAHAGSADDTPTRWARPKCTKSHTHALVRRET